MQEKDRKRLEFLLDEAFDNFDIDTETEIELDKNFKFSEEHERKMKKIFKKFRMKKKLQKVNQLVKKIAIVLLLVVIGTSIVTFSVEAYRIKFLNFIMNHKEKYTEINYRKENQEKLDKSDEFVWQDIKFDYIPQGYVNSEFYKDENEVFLYFEREEKYFAISASIEEGKIRVDSENADMEVLIIDDKECTIFEKDENRNIYFTNFNVEFYIYGNIEKEEMIHIIKEIKKI